MKKPTEESVRRRSPTLQHRRLGLVLPVEHAESHDPDFGFQGLTNQQLLEWREFHEFTHTEAALRLGVSRRSYVLYETTGPVPKTVSLACEAVTNSVSDAHMYGRLLERDFPGKYQPVRAISTAPRTGDFYHVLAVYQPIEHNSILTRVFYNSVGFGVLAQTTEWIERNKSSAKIKKVSVMNPANRIVDLIVLTFETRDDARAFEHRWVRLNDDDQ